MFYTPSNEELNQFENHFNDWSFIKNKYIIEFALLPDEITSDTFKALSQGKMSQKEATCQILQYGYEHYLREHNKQQKNYEHYVQSSTEYAQIRSNAHKSQAKDYHEKSEDFKEEFVELGCEAIIGAQKQDFDGT